jgi:uncharacterized protein YkwD
LSLILLAFVASLLAVLVVPALGDSGTTVPEPALDVVAVSRTSSSPNTPMSTTTSTTVVATTTTSTTTSTTVAPTTTTQVVTATTNAPPTTTTTAPSAAATVKAPVTTTTTPLTATATTVPSTTPTTSAPAPTTTTTTEPQRVAGFDSSAESQFVSLVNNLRASVGLPTLAHVGVLQSYSRSWSQHMAETGTFEHSNLYDIPGPWQSVAENIAASTSVQSAFNALVASSGHYANMVNPTFTEIGSGVWTDAGGKLWVTHVFRG